MLEHLIEFFARTHLVALHFPIALLIIAAVIELYRALSPKLRRDGTAGPYRPGPTGNTLFVFGFLACAYTVITGLVFGFDDGERVDLHRILGIATGVLVLLTAFALLMARKPTPGAAGRAYLVLLTLTAIATGLTGHFGGDLTHGKGFITRPLAQAFGSATETTTQPAIVYTPQDFNISQSAFDTFNASILPILEDACVECHGPDEAEDDIRLDTLAYVLDPDADMIKRDVPDHSELIYRIDLPAGDPDIMPPEDHADPLSTEQIELVRAWVHSLAAD
ncbi:MAG: c-type cytochrome domain-containing protein [Phycisphaerales bacterium JB052]